MTVLNTTQRDGSEAETKIIVKAGKKFKMSTYRLPANKAHDEIFVTEYEAESGGRVVVENECSITRWRRSYFVQEMPGDRQRRFAGKKFDAVMAAL